MHRIPALVFIATCAQACKAPPPDTTPSDRGCTVVSRGELSLTITRLTRDALGRTARVESWSDDGVGKLNPLIGLLEFPKHGAFERSYGKGIVTERGIEEQEEKATYKVEYHLDAQGRVLEERSPKERTVHAYEGARLVRTEYPTGRTLLYRYFDEPRHVEVTAHEKDGSQHLLLDCLLDAADRELECRNGESGITGRYVRDASGAVTDEWQSGKSPSDRTHRHCTLDSLHRPQRCTWDSGADGSVEIRTVFAYGPHYGAHPCAADSMGLDGFRL